MNKKLRNGKSSELMVASVLTRNEIDVYFPLIDDIAIDMIVRTDKKYYDIQIKSVKGYNRIVGIKDLDKKKDNYIIVIHYRHNKKADEFFYLTLNQAKQYWKKVDKDGKLNPWGDLIFNKPEREKHIEQNLENLAEKIKNGEI